MNFEHMEYLPFILLAAGTFCVMTFMLEKKFFQMVKTYWFFNRSIFSYVSSILLFSGFTLLLLSLLDARGPEKRIKGAVHTEKTIILLDTSASMLAEDVKPSRLQKAVLIAKHFARKATGHQLSVIAFAEVSKKIVPFTSDLDLIDARLDSLKALRNQNGSSALTLAIQESVQYFKEAGQDRGNILVLTDGEETTEGIKINLSKDYHVALVGVGTEQGGRIPLDDARGFRFGYKKTQGRDVITKLNENFFKQVTSDIPSSEYWLSNTYSLPSEEILDFFKVEFKKGEGNQDMVMKPVMMEWIVVPALILLIASYMFKAVRIFSLGLLLLISPIRAQNEEPEIKIPPEVALKLESLQKGELTQLERLKLADDLKKAGAKDESLAIYEENLPIDHFDSKLPPEAYLNYGTGLLEKGDGPKGMTVYEGLSNSLDPASTRGKQLKQIMDKNVTRYFTVQEQKEQQKKKDDKKKSEEDQKEKEKENQGAGEGDTGKPDQKEKGSGGDPKDKQDESGKDKKEEKDKSQEKDKEGEEKKDDKDGEQDNSQQPSKLPPKKIPAKLKQLMSDDRQLQMKMIENGTRELNKRPRSRKNKDW